MFEDQVITVLKFLPFSGDPDTGVFKSFKSILSHKGFSAVQRCRSVWPHQGWKQALDLSPGTRQGQAHPSNFLWIQRKFCMQNMPTENNGRLWGTAHKKNVCYCYALITGASYYWAATEQRFAVQPKSALTTRLNPVGTSVLLGNCQRWNRSQVMGQDSNCTFVGTDPPTGSTATWIPVWNIPIYYFSKHSDHQTEPVGECINRKTIHSENMLS